jgi:hypothetical protein
MDYDDRVVALKAYAADCRVFGTVDLGDRRMTDVLNATPEIRVVAARLEDLESDTVVEMPELLIGREELCVVEATGPQGDPDRRLRTRTTRVAVEIGPYRIEGWVHGTAASDPFATMVRRATWVALTDAILSERVAGPTPDAEVRTLIVNRELATVFREIEETLTALPWETWERPAAHPRRGADMTNAYPDETARNRDDNDRPRAPDTVV